MRLFSPGMNCLHSSPLRISTPKLTRIGEKCIIDRKLLGVLMPNNGSEFQYMLKQKVDDQDTQFLLIGNNGNSHCFIKQNNAAYCLPIDSNCVPCIQKIIKSENLYNI